MSNKPVIEGLKKTLADSYTLMTKTQNYHWNVEGPQFSSLHVLFEGQYNELFAAVDVLAERIRALGEKAPGSNAEFKKLSSIAEGNSEFDATQMLSDLVDSNAVVLATLKKALAAAEKASDAPSADLVTQRITAHEKTVWMLKSSLPVTAKTKLKAAS